MGAIILAPPNTKTLTQRYYERVVYNRERYSDLAFMDAIRFLESRWSPSEWARWQFAMRVRTKRVDYQSSELGKVLPLLGRQVWPET